VTISALLALGCSDDNGSTGTTDKGPTQDQGPPADTGPAEDKGPAGDGPSIDGHTDGPAGDVSLVDQGPAADMPAAQSEKEPNNGGTATELNAIQVPAVIKGAIGQAKDVDIFGVDAKAGDRWVVTVKTDGTLQPHLAVFDPAQKVPTAVSKGAGDVMAEYYVLKTTQLLIAVRDQRNVGSGSQSVGGPAFTYTLSVLPLNRPPKQVQIGSLTTGTLSPPGTVRVYAFSALNNTELVLQVAAKKLSPPSDVDSRLSLFHPGQKAWLGTNDNPSLSESDSLLKGKMPFTGTYHAIVENVADTIGSNLSFTLKISKAP
jgi:hypothetical protein